MRKRLELVAYRGTTVTSDTAEALRRLEVSTASRVPKARIHYYGVRDRDAVSSDPLSLASSGREVHLSLLFPDEERRLVERRVEILWSLAVPLGFTPFNRYPLPGPNDDVFHFLGPWQPLYDGLCAEGRGDLAWPSLCCAAQVDVGNWAGDRPTERFVQAQLHRLGSPCGPVDGEMRESVQAALAERGIHGMALTEVADHLVTLADGPVRRNPRRYGNLSLPDVNLQVYAYGNVTATRHRNGAAISVTGPGRIVIDVDGYSSGPISG